MPPMGPREAEERLIDRIHELLREHGLGAEFDGASNVDYGLVAGVIRVYNAVPGVVLCVEVREDA